MALLRRLVFFLPATRQYGACSAPSKLGAREAVKCSKLEILRRFSAAEAAACMMLLALEIRFDIRAMASPYMVDRRLESQTCCRQDSCPWWMGRSQDSGVRLHNSDRLRWRNGDLCWCAAECLPGGPIYRLALLCFHRQGTLRDCQRGLHRGQHAVDHHYRQQEMSINIIERTWWTDAAAEGRQNKNGRAHDP